MHGPEPHPDWLVTELAARDTELGVLKTGKEADVHLVRRAVPQTDRSCLLAAKRYRDAQHRLFHRDAGYLEGRRVRRSRENRAMAGADRLRPADDRRAVGGGRVRRPVPALGDRRVRRIAVPYPVQLLGTELMLEFVGDPDEGRAAPRLAQLRPEAGRAARPVGATGRRAGACSPGPASRTATCPRTTCWCTPGGWCIIDLPQVVDVVANPQGPEFLARDVRVVATWFAGAGPARRRTPIRTR